MLLLMMIIFFALLFLGVPVAFAMGIATSVTLITDTSLPNFVMAQTMFGVYDSFAMLAVPFFMLAGALMEETGITRNLVKLSDSLVGHIKGGLAHTTVLAGILLAGISGSANADATALGSMMVPALAKEGYEDGVACNIVASSAALGPIIPPSITCIIYAGIAGVSVTKLFMAGYIPGVLIGVFTMFICYLYAKRNGLNAHKFLGWKNAGKSFVSSIPALMLPVIIIGGILSGVFTATEAGVVACIYAIAYGFITRTLAFSKFKSSLLAAGVNTSVPLFIMATAKVFGYILTRQNFGNTLSGFLTGVTTDGHVLLVLFVILLMILGMFIDGTAVMLMLVPLLTPILPTYGIDPIQFAMVFLIALEAGGLTPPVGMTLYVVCSAAKVKFSKCVRPAFIFAGIMYLVVLLIIFIPQIALLIPGLVVN